ncbi:MAG: hypothetical protein QNI97_08110 [Desulfobacterales bacterium]|nr:hypothetical protein [Desulfobacterales bacterium]
MGRWGIGIIAVCLLTMPGSTIAGLGMHRDIVFYIEPQSGLPLQIDDYIAKAGAGSLKLREVHLKP